MRRWIIIVVGTFAVGVPICWLIVDTQIQGVRSSHKRDLESTSDQADYIEKLGSARAMALLHKYPVIDVGWLDKLIAHTSLEHNIPELKLWEAVPGFLDEIVSVPDDQKQAALEKLIRDSVRTESPTAASM